VELILKLNDKGRILIPANIRKALKIKNAVKVIVKNNELIIKPIEDPIEALTKTIIKGSTDIEKEIREFRRIAENEAHRRLGERWS